MNRQKLITILATIAIIATLTVSLFYPFGSATATTYNADNMTVNGVLASDNYVLFPYENYNLIFGFSKYGELINGVAKQGLEYRGMDVFANPNVLEKDWSQGWFIDIHYADLENNYKRAWAFALYSDLSGSSGIGGAWKEGCTAGPLGTPYGGRKTNVWATTDDIKVLYDGPRRFVAVTNTTLYGASTKTAEDALVSITITFVFNKDKKEVVLYKDIKRLDKGKFGRTFQVEFSNRGEWDIGATSAPPSYAHFYDNLATVYDHHYHDFYNAVNDITGYDMCQMIDEDGTYVGFAAFWPQLFGKLVDGTTHITRSTILSSLCTIEKNYTWLALGSPENKQIAIRGLGWPNADPYPIGLGAVNDEPMVYKNLELLTGGVEYTWVGGATDTITFTIEPADTDYITVVYKHETNSGADDMVSHAGSEPDTPYVIGEWCFELKNEDYKRQFRAVTMYGLTDRHDADDNDAAAETWSDGANVIDCEVQYYLNETFNPFDLYSAVHKQEYRWVDIRTLTSTASYITLTDGLDDDIYQPNGYSQRVLTASQTWTGYNYTTSGDTTFDWVNNFEDGVTSHSKNWMAYLNATADAWCEVMLKLTPAGYGVNITGALTFSSIVDFGFWYYSFAGSEGGPHIEFELYNSTGTGYIVLGAVPNHHKTGGVHDYCGEWTHYTLNNISNYTGDYYHDADKAFYIRWCPAAVLDDFGVDIQTYDTFPTDLHGWEWFEERLGSFSVGSIGVSLQNATNIAGECYVDDFSVAYLEKTSGLRYERVYNMEEDKLIPTDWDRYCSFAERVLVDGVLIDRYPYHLLRNYVEGGHAPYYTINFETGTITFYHWVTSAYVAWTLPIGTHIKVLYSTIEENEKGRYEWMVVGKDAATIDSIGAAYMTEAFDSIKDIHVQVTALDINDTVYGPHTPFVMGSAVTGTKADYRDSLGRTYLRDDWCTTYPVASSNMLFAGGPEVNMGAEYFNEFTMAFFARTEYVVNDTGHAYEIFALSCWNKYSYGSGYAVVSVYKDLNGTIGFLIWGFTGDDTYYATKWFWETGIEYLQTENRGVTDIILEIDYTTCPYSVDIARNERLGTISEKACHDP